jgi:hypothetical protein
MTVIPAGGRLSFNNGNALASGNVARVQTYRTFPMYLSYPLYWESEQMFTQDPVAENVCEFGLGYATGVAQPTDGVYFRLAATGVLLGCISNNSAEQTVALSFVPAASVRNHYTIVLYHDRVEFWIDNVLYGVITTGIGIGCPIQSTAAPLLLREYNANVTAVAQRMEIFTICISSGDINSTRLWPTVQVGQGNSSVNVPDGTTAGFTANFASNICPATATPTGVAAAYATMGGQWAIFAPASSDTDLILFGYPVPVSTAAIPGKNLIVRGIRIDSWVQYGTITTTPTMLQWTLGIGSTGGTTLATVDSATAGTRACRRLTLGAQTFALGAVAGTPAQPIDINLDAPIMVEAGTFLQILIKAPMGTATGGVVIRGLAMINGYFE